MDLNKIIDIVNGKCLNEFKNKKINKIVTDTRKLKKQDLFVALKGKKYDGHDFINDIKCSGIIIDEDINISTNVPVFKVNSTYDALFNLGLFFRKQYNRN